MGARKPKKTPRRLANFECAEDRTGFGWLIRFLFSGKEKSGGVYAAWKPALGDSVERFVSDLRGLADAIEKENEEKDRGDKR